MLIQIEIFTFDLCNVLRGPVSDASSLLLCSTLPGVAYLTSITLLDCTRSLCLCDRKPLSRSIIILAAL